MNQQFIFICYLLLFSHISCSNLKSQILTGPQGYSISLKKMGSIKDYLLSILSDLQDALENYDSFTLNSAKTKIKKLIPKNVSNNKASQEKSVSRNIPLKNFKNTQYIGIIEVGMPGQPIPVIFDTGSGNLWVTSSLCKAKACTTHPSYSHAQSKKFKKLGLGVSVTFGTGKIIGEINQDQFKLGNLIIADQKFGEILDEIGEVFEHGEFSGILGLSYPALAADNIVPVFDNIIRNKFLDKNIISFFYSLNEHTEGQITFGYIDSTKYIGKINYYPVIDQHYWTIQLDDIKYAGKSLGLCPNKCKAVIDTGTTLITGPSKDLKVLLKAIPIGNDCKNYHLGGKLTFVFGGEEFDLNTDEHIFQSDVLGVSSCRALMMPIDVPEPHGPLWVIGDIFMQKYYTVFNRDNNTVGFALAKHSEQKGNYA